MPRSARSFAGFTLLEALVALAIVGAVSSLVVVSATPSDASLAEREARRLAVLLELALSEARAGARPIAWSYDAEGYTFWKESPTGEWRAFPDTSPYRRRTLPARVEVRAARADAVALAAGERVVMRPYGLPAHLTVTFAAGRARVVMKGHALGPMSLERLYAD